MLTCILLICRVKIVKFMHSVWSLFSKQDIDIKTNSASLYESNSLAFGPLELVMTLNAYREQVGQMSRLVVGLAGVRRAVLVTTEPPAQLESHHRPNLLACQLA